MSELTEKNFEDVLAKPGFLADIETMLEHQVPHSGQPEHQDCIGMHYSKMGANLFKPSGVISLHEPPEDLRLGHITEQAWGNVGLYMTARDDLTPTRADITALEELHAGNPYIIRGFVTRHVVFGDQYLFLRGQLRRGFEPGPLRQWDDQLPLAQKIRLLRRSELSLWIKGLATKNVSVIYHNRSQLFKPV